MPYQTNMDPKTKGELSEAKVLSRLMELGDTVLTPFGENCDYDLVIDDGVELRRVQVKTGRMEDGKVVASLSRTRVNSKGSTRKNYDDGSIDAFVIYCHDNDAAYWVDLEDAGKVQISIRVDPPHERHRNNRNINWADAHRL